MFGPGPRLDRFGLDLLHLIGLAERGTRLDRLAIFALLVKLVVDLAKSLGEECTARAHAK